MITGIAIENFKGIGDRVELELRPITLLFGANSAGKSTILHALHYAREVFERHNLDADQTISGGEFVDLGGFENLVHAHDRNRKVSISLTLSITPDDLDNLDLHGIPILETSITEFCREFNQVEVMFVIGWTATHNAPTILRYEIAIDGQNLATISKEVGRPECVFRFDSGHPVFLSCTDCQNEALLMSHPLSLDEYGDQTIIHALWDWFSHNGWIGGEITAEDDGTFELYIDQPRDALPHIDEALAFRTILPPKHHPDRPDDYDYDDDNFAIASVVALLSRLVVGPANLARSALAKFRYLGPLRETPPRNYAPPRFPDDSRWASGLGAWDTLQNASDEFVDTVGDWLGDEDKLKSGYRIERRNFKELDLADPLVIKLLSGRAFDEADEQSKLNLDQIPTQSRIVIAPLNSEIELRPHDVGIGISQVVPVVVTALADEKWLLSIEQPELHLHPKLQAELGDLFIEAALGDRRHTIILETHSELIPLRLMRRIRETADGKLESGRPPISSKDVAIYYVEMHNSSTIVTHLELGERGQLLDPWPEGFFEEGFRERFTE